MADSVTLWGLMGIMLVGVSVGRGIRVGAAVTAGRFIGVGVRLPFDRKVSTTAIRTTTAAIISIRKDGGGGSGRLVGVEDITSGIAPTACMEASSVAWTW